MKKELGYKLFLKPLGFSNWNKLYWLSFLLSGRFDSKIYFQFCPKQRENDNHQWLLLTPDIEVKNRPRGHFLFGVNHELMFILLPFKSKHRTSDRNVISNVCSPATIWCKSLTLHNTHSYLDVKYPQQGKHWWRKMPHVNLLTCSTWVLLLWVFIDTKLVARALFYFSIFHSNWFLKYGMSKWNRVSKGYSNIFFHALFIDLWDVF